MVDSRAERFTDGRRARYLALVGVAVVLVSLVLAARVAAATGGVSFRLDPLGSDAASRQGDLQEPFRTLEYAVARAVAVRALNVEISLARGVFAVHAEGGGSPLEIPPGWRTLVLSGEGAASEIVGADACAGLLQWNPDGVEGIDGASDGLRIELRNVQLRGGLTGLVVSGGAERDLSLTVRQCLFSSQQAVGVEVSAASGRSTNVSVRECEFRGGGGGVAVEALTDANVTVDVLDCRFEDPEPSVGAAFHDLTAGVAMHADPASRVQLVVERNTFMDVATAVQLTAAPDDGAGGAANRIAILGNLVVGSSFDGRPGVGNDPGAARYGVDTPVYLGLWPHDGSEVVISQNTFFGVDRFVVQQDNLSELDSQLEWTFANNICWGIHGGSEFASEIADLGVAAAGVVDRPELTIRNNLLEKSWVATAQIDGNFSADPRFVAALDETLIPEGFRLGADSPALERGLNEYAEGISVDLDGGCRVAAATCSGRFRVDLGAFEAQGTCSESDARFLRGDCDPDGSLTLNDSVVVLGFLFLGWTPPVCLDACDADDTGELAISDALFGLSFLFLGGSALPPPAVAPGQDPTCDNLPSCGTVLP